MSEETNATQSQKWQPVGGGHRRYQKWDIEGEVIRGVYRGTEPGKFGLNAVIEDEDGVAVCLTLSAGLKDLTTVEPGTPVKVTFQRWAVSKGGNRFRLFRIEEAAA